MRVSNDDMVWVTDALRHGVARRRGHQPQDGGRGHGVVLPLQQEREEVSAASRARYVQHTNGPFTCAPPSPRRQIDRWRGRGRNSIFTLLFSLSLHTFPKNHLSAYLSAICRRLPTDKGLRGGHLSTFATNADRSPTLDVTNRNLRLLACVLLDAVPRRPSNHLRRARSISIQCLVVEF